MADSKRQIAEKSVAIACAITSPHFVKIISLEDMDISPEGLFELTFTQIGIFNEAQVEAFRATLIHLLPDSLLNDLEKMPLSVGILIGLVVNHVEALLLAQK